MLSITICFILMSAVMALKVKDVRLLAASVILLWSMQIQVSWDWGLWHGYVLLIAGAIDILFVLLFFRYSNAVYGTVMGSLLLLQVMVHFGFFINMEFIGEYFHTNHEYLNDLITLIQAVSLMIIGGLRAGRIDLDLVEEYYNSRLNNLASILPFKIVPKWL